MEKREIGDVGERKRHIKYFKQCLNLLPARLAYLDSQRLVLAHFALGGLCLLDAIDELTNQSEIIEWIYSLQSETGGFYGSEMMSNLPPDVAQPHIASTFSALQSLLMLHDDLSRVKVDPLLSWLCQLQTNQGSFCGAANNTEQADMRFSYCAAFIYHIFGGTKKSPFDETRIARAVDFIRQCQSPDSAFGQVPGSEGHGALTFCALAALKLFGKSKILTDAESARIARFCVNRQKKGIHGRPHKDDDSCYTFWTSAALKLATPHIPLSDQLDVDEVVAFVTSCCDDFIGGVSKYPGNTPDPTHAFLALAGVGVIFNSVLPEYMLTKQTTGSLLKIRNRINSSNATYENPCSIRAHMRGILISVSVGLVAIYLAQKF